MSAPTIPSPVPTLVPRSTSTTGDAGRLPMRPLDLHPTPSQLARSERATAHSGVASPGWRFRWLDEAACGQPASGQPASDEDAGGEGAAAARPAR